MLAVATLTLVVAGGGRGRPAKEDETSSRSTLGRFIEEEASQEFEELLSGDVRLLRKARPALACPPRTTDTQEDDSAQDYNPPSPLNAAALYTATAHPTGTGEYWQDCGHRGLDTTGFNWDTWKVG